MVKLDKNQLVVESRFVSSDNTILYLSNGLFLLTAIIAGILFYRHRKTSQQLYECQNQLAELQQRPVLLSHEIRTPLALVKGAGELLAEQTPGPLNPQQLQFVSTITENSQRVIDMAEDFLTNTRLDTQGLHYQPIDLRELVGQTAREMRRIHNCQILVDSQSAPLEIWADPDLIRQLVWNLIKNAILHAGDAVTVHVSVKEVATGACLKISDDGVGISASDLKKLFHPFRSGGGLRPGTGLGMSVSKRIVDAHGGKIIVDSLQKRGTVMIVVLPSRPPVNKETEK